MTLFQIQKFKQKNELEYKPNRAEENKKHYDHSSGEKQCDFIGKPIKSILKEKWPANNSK